MKILLIVGALIACLVLVSVFFRATPIANKVNSNAEKAKILKAEMDIGNIINLLDMFKFDNEVYPTSDEGLKALLENPDPEKYKKWSQYLTERRFDPWGNEYQYVNNNVEGGIEVYSFGPDGTDNDNNIGSAESKK